MNYVACTFFRSPTKNMTVANSDSNYLKYPKEMFEFVGRGNKGTSQMLDYKCLLHKCGSKSTPTIIRAGPRSRFNIRRHVKVTN